MKVYITAYVTRIGIGATSPENGGMVESRQDIAIVRDIAREGGSVLLSYFRSASVDVWAKGDRDVVTAADFAVEELVRRRLREAFPGDGVRGEEGTAVTTAASRVWCIDPLDGTLNFSRGLPMWCVSISLFVGDSPRLGVIFDPLGDECFAASSGSGAWLNDAPLATSGLARADDALVHLTVDFHDESRDEGLKDLVKVAPRVLRTRNFGSAALGLAYVACGRLDAMLHRHAYEWDYGAGVVLVREAGGSVSDLSGREYGMETRAVAVASTEDLRRSILGIIRNGGTPVE